MSSSVARTLTASARSSSAASSSPSARLLERADLATPQINIAYGTWYLRYLLTKYHGNTILALAAYNAGEGKVDAWWQQAAERGEQFRVADHIPFPETRDYVGRVLAARDRYRHEYARELGL